MATATNLTMSVLGTFYRPVQEYQDSHDRLKYASSSSRCNQVVEINSSITAMSTHHENGPEGTDANDRNRCAKSEASNVQNRPKQVGGQLFGRMTGASAKSLGSFVPTALKGMTVDIPLALTEGLRNFPRYYGEEPRDHGPVTDIKSGFTVAGKGFAWGMTEAVTDIVVKPYQGLREGGARGAVTGVGKGMANMVSKAGCAMFGVVVYPGAGIAQSLRSSILSRARKMIMKARHGEGMWLLQSDQHHSDIVNTLDLFKRQLEGKKS
jgi:hypothetical protein